MEKLSRSETRKAIKNSMREGALSDAGSSMRSADFLTAFALALGANSGMIGILSAVPRLFRLISLMFTSKLICKIKSTKTLTVIFAILSRILWVPILFVPYFGENSLLALLAIVSVTSAFSELSSAVWTSWMCDVFPEKTRGKYFGRRARVTIGASFIATMITGWLLNLYNSVEGFFVVFSMSIALSMFSSYFLTKIPEIDDKLCYQKVRFSMKHFLRGVSKHKNYSNYVMLMSLLYFSTSLIGPFIAVHLLKNLGFDYFTFSIIYSIEILMMMLAEPYWGKLSDKFGDKAIMAVSYSMIPLVPLLMLFMKTPLQALPIFIFSGFAWAGFEIASFNYLLDCAPKKGQPVFIANYKAFFNIATFLGPLIGGALLTFFGDLTFLTLSGIPLLFLISFALRALFAGLTLPRISEIRGGSHKPFSEIFIKAVAIYPASATKNELVYVGRHMHKWEKKVFKGVPT